MSTTHEISIYKEEGGTLVDTITTTNKRLRDAVYKYKKSHSINFPTTWESKVVPSVVIDARIPSFGDLKENTRITYRQHLKNYFRSGREINNFDDIKSYGASVPLNSRHGIYYVSMLMNKGDEVLRTKIKGLIRETFADVRLARARPKEAVITLEALRAKYKEFITTKPSDIDKFIAQWYAYGLPWRGDTLVHITKKDKKLNQFFPNKRIIKMNHFKTVSSHGSKETPLTLDMVKMLKTGFKASGSKGLILGDMKPPQVSRVLKGVYGVGINPIRHAHVTSARASLEDAGFKAFCDNINTSVACGLDVYTDGD